MILPAKPFYLVRHGQTDANAARICSGGTEAALTAKGEEQADMLGALMDQVVPRPSLIIHSGRTRTIGTAARINKKLGLPVEQDTGLDEHNFGDWIGRSVDPYVELAQSGEPVPNGEDLPTFSGRIRRTIADILGRVPGPPLLVAHGGLFRAFAFMHEQPIWRSGNCVLHYFEPKEAAFPWRIWRFAAAGGSLNREEVNISTDYMTGKAAVTHDLPPAA